MMQDLLNEMRSMQGVRPLTTKHVRLIRAGRAARIPVHRIAAELGVSVSTVKIYSSDEIRERERQRQSVRAKFFTEREREARRVAARKAFLKRKAARKNAAT